MGEFEYLKHGREGLKKRETNDSGEGVARGERRRPVAERISFDLEFHYVMNCHMLKSATLLI